MACEREKQAVLDLRTELSSLQEDLHQSPGQKAGILAQIKGVQKDLAAAEAALKTCQEPGVTGKVRPRYQVLFVVYAPPGNAGGRNISVVDYGEGSTVGSTVSTASSFRDGTSVTASASGGIFAGGSVSTGLDLAATKTDSTSIDMKKSKSWDIRVSGPTADGIDHDRDLYDLWLNPVLTVTIGHGRLTWGFDPAGGPMNLKYVYGGWLKKPATMPPDVQASLAGAGITPADYPRILSTNPFSSGTTINPDRFLPTDRTFPYEPPFSASDSVPTMTFVQKNDTTRSSNKKFDVEYGVSVSISADVGFGDLFKASLKVSDSFKWTNSSTLGTSTLSSQSATVTVGGPSFGYRGPTDVLV
jgi:hypothetical protein